MGGREVREGENLGVFESSGDAASLRRFRTAPDVSNNKKLAYLPSS